MRKTENVCIRATQDFKIWLKRNRCSPTVLLMERARQLGYKEAGK